MIEDTIHRMNMNEILSAIDTKISRLQQVRALLTSSGIGIRGKKSATAGPGKAKRTISAEGRKRIAEAQRERWAAQKKAAK